MEFTKEFLEKVQAVKTAEELLEIAKAENIEMTAEQAEKMFAELHKSGELSDDELENAAGGAIAACMRAFSPETSDDVTCIDPDICKSLI